MKITGSNITKKDFRNEFTQSKDLQIEHYGAKAELITTKRGIAFYIGDCKLVKNGSGFLILNKDQEVFDFEEIIKECEEENKNGND